MFSVYNNGEIEKMKNVAAFFKFLKKCASPSWVAGVEQTPQKI